MYKQHLGIIIISFSLIILLGLSCDADAIDDNKTIESEQIASIPNDIDFNFHVKPILSDRCYACHGPDPGSREGGLAFHKKEMATALLGENKDRQAIFPGNINKSELVKRIYATDENEVMPPPESNLTLTDYEKQILSRWIEQGAEWKEHWSFIKPIETPIPEIKQSQWANNEIDFFIGEKLEEMGLSPAEPASKEKLLRRLSFDLTGLPPSIHELNNFLNNDDQNAVEQEIDRLLNSKAYAERMANEWMDIARYADTHGYQDDFERIMWPWRDWVIHAFDKNLSYKDFITWQLGGDLLENPSLEQVIATGFNRNHKITFEGGSLDEEFRVEYVADRVQTFGKALLGINVDCARCHDHKFDPISQKEYYSMFSYFNNLPEKGFVEGDGTIPEPYVVITQENIEAQAQFINNIDSMPEIHLMVMKEQAVQRQAYVLNRGAYDQRTEKVNSSTPAFLPNTSATNRLELADWLFNEDHPLTSRVAVNRIWQQLFGMGIVATSFDFGSQGSLPSHPELLDYLALKFQSFNWDMKAMIKYICLSSTYQQGSNVSVAQRELDPENRYLSYYPRKRLTAEMIRDQALYISGLMNPMIGGPSVKPYQPEGLWEETTGGGGGKTAKYVQSEGSSLYRRSLYTYWKRTLPPPNMMTMDTPSRDFCTVKRENTNTPLQALILMNDPQIIEASRMLATNAINSFSEDQDIIHDIFLRATSRKASEEEISILQTLLKEELKSFEAQPDSAEIYLSIGDMTIDSGIVPHRLAAYTFLASTILNLDETINKG